MSAVGDGKGAGGRRHRRGGRCASSVGRAAVVGEFYPACLEKAETEHPGLSPDRAQKSYVCAKREKSRDLLGGPHGRGGGGCILLRTAADLLLPFLTFFELFKSWLFLLNNRVLKAVLPPKQGDLWCDQHGK